MAETLIDIKNKSNKSIKWSFFTEFFAKIATPLSTMILARLLTPEIFGVATAVTIVVSFCEAVTETGFSKYLIQKDFNNLDEYKRTASVSLFVSLFFSLILVAIIIIFRFPISNLLGNHGYESILVVASLQLPFTAINSVFLACLKREFYFNKIFFVRILHSLTPFLITLPLAILNFGPWSLVIGTIGSVLLQTPFLLFFNKNRFNIYFSFKLFLKIIKESYIMIIESLVIWFSSYLSIFLTSLFFSSYYVGIVKVSSSTIVSIFSLFSIGITNVLFSGLSRLKNNLDFNIFLKKMQISAFVIFVPLGVCCFLFSNILSEVFLGDSWTGAAFVLGVLALSQILQASFNNFLSEVFRSKGHFIFSIIYHVVILLVSLVIKITLGQISFEAFVWSNLVSAIAMALLSIVIFKKSYGVKINSELTPFLKICLISFVFLPFGFLQSAYSYSLPQQIAQILIALTIYGCCTYLFYKRAFYTVLENFGIKQ